MAEGRLGAYAAGIVALWVAATACGESASGDAPAGTDPGTSNGGGSDGGSGGSGGSGGGTNGGGSGGGNGGGSSHGDAGSTNGGSDGGGGGSDAGSVTPPPGVHVLGTIATTADPAFVYLASLPSGHATLALTTFAPFGTSGVSTIADIGTKLGALGSASDTWLVNSGITWPNEAKSPPSGIFPSDGLVVAGGFLVPGNTTGAIHFVDASGKATKLSTDKTDYFYHRAEWLDLNGDGKKDILTARATKPLIGGSTAGELLWLEQPASNPLGGAWKEHSLLAGASAPDVDFAVADLDADGSPEIVAAQFFSGSLVLYWFDGSADAGAPKLSSFVIDDKIGSAFDVQVVDLNGDGRMDLLATNHESTAANASVFAYEMPAHPKSDPWTRHTLASGFTATAPNAFTQNASAPGQALAFQPHVGDTGKKPLIAVAGDDSQKEVLLTPASNSASDWTYQRAEIVDTKTTCGRAEIADVDGDGWVEMFVPAYGKKLIYVVTFKP